MPRVFLQDACVVWSIGLITRNTLVIAAVSDGLAGGQRDQS